MDNLVSVFTEDQVASITGVSKSQLRYWDRTDFFSPSEVEQHAGQRFGRVYSFRDLACLKILNDLRNKAKVPLHLLRELKNSWAREAEDIWLKHTLYAVNKRVVMDSALGLVDAQTGQRVLKIAIKAEFEKIRNNVESLFKREKSTVGKICQSRNVAANKPVVAGTRIPVKSIKAFANEGFSVEQIQSEYPGLTKKDIKSAIGY